MRKPVVLVAGQQNTDPVVGTLLRTCGTLVVEHRFDGYTVRRMTVDLQHGVLTTAEIGIELAHGCVSCTIRNDLLVLLRQLSRRDDVDRIVVHLAPWLEPEPICWAINNVRIRVASGYIDGPAALDVRIAAVVTCVDSSRWLRQVLGEGELDDGRTEAQVVVGQAEFADVIVLSDVEPILATVLRRLAPRARIGYGANRIEQVLAGLDSRARRGRDDDPHGPLLSGQPPLEPTGTVQLVEFSAQRPFHPQRLYDRMELLLEGVIRTRGRLWLAGQDQQAMWLESAGGGWRVGSADKWLTAMTDAELAGVDDERRALAQLRWDPLHGDRHTAMTILVYSADSGEILDGLGRALLTDDELCSPADWDRYPDPFGDWSEDLTETADSFDDMAAIQNADHRAN